MARVTCAVFVYGTLKPGEANYQAYCGGKVRSQTSVYTWAELYALPVGYPAMIEGKNKVYGVLLKFDDPLVLNSLDRLEDYQPQRASDLNEYERQLVSVYSFGDRLLGQAWAYYMTRAKVRQYRGVKVASGCWTSSFQAKC